MPCVVPRVPPVVLLNNALEPTAVLPKPEVLEKRVNAPLAGVFRASRVAQERPSTSCRVLVCGVAKERPSTDGRVELSFRVAL